MSDHITKESVAQEFSQLAVDVTPVETVENTQAEAERQEQILIEGSSEYKALLAQLLGPSFALLAPNWNVQEQEVEALSESYAVVLYKYFPDSLGQMAPELGALLVSLAIFTPRMNMPRVVAVEPPKLDLAAEIEGDENGGS